MEPTKNNNSLGGNNLNNGTSSEPVFHGMPKPGQPLTSTPRVEPKVNFTESTTTTTTSKFSAHSPSALDRLMNPNLSASPATAPVASTNSFSSAVPNPSTSATPKPVASMPTQIQSSTPSTSNFKPYTPVQPVVVSSTVSSAVPHAPTPASAATTSFSSTPTPTFSTASNPMSAPSKPVTSTNSSTYTSSTSKVTTPNNYSSSAFSGGVPAAPSSTVTSSKLSSEVNNILNNKPTEPNKHKNTLGLIIGAVIVLLLLVGGGYYWFAFMRTPGEANPNAETPNNTTNTDRPASAFPAAATQPNVARPTTPTTPAKPTTPTKVTRVTTPFNQTQRAIVSSYISSHINELAPIKSKSSYEVTDITFDGPDRAIVQYTDGQNSYSAIAVASIDTADNVRILSFNLLEK